MLTYFNTTNQYRSGPINFFFTLKKLFKRRKRIRSRVYMNAISVFHDLLYGE